MDYDHVKKQLGYGIQTESKDNAIKAIEQLTARITELEEKNARLKAAVEYAETIRVENIAYFEKQLATSQLRETQLGEALQTYIDEHEECQDADDWMAMMCSMEAHHAANNAILGFAAGGNLSGATSGSAMISHSHSPSVSSRVVDDTAETTRTPDPEPSYSSSDSSSYSCDSSSWSSD